MVVGVIGARANYLGGILGIRIWVDLTFPLWSPKLFQVHKRPLFFREHLYYYPGPALDFAEAFKHSSPGKGLSTWVVHEAGINTYPACGDAVIRAGRRRSSTASNTGLASLASKFDLEFVAA